MKVYFVWNTDSAGAYIYSIHKTEEGAENARRSLDKSSSWIEDHEVDE